MPKTKLSKRVFLRGQKIRITSEGFCITGQYGKIVSPARERGVYWVELDNMSPDWLINYHHMEKVK